MFGQHVHETKKKQAGKHTNVMHEHEIFPERQLKAIETQSTYWK